MLECFSGGSLETASGASKLGQRTATGRLYSLSSKIFYPAQGRSHLAKGEYKGQEWLSGKMELPKVLLIKKKVVASAHKLA